MDITTIAQSSGTTLEIVIWSLFAGICLGIICGIYVKVILGAFVRKLLETGANSPSTAQTLDSSGLTPNPIVRFPVRHALREGSSYRKIVRTSDPENQLAQSLDDQPAVEIKRSSKRSKTSAIDFSAAKFYIPDEFSFRASQIYDNRGNSVLFALISILAFLIVACLSFYIVPELISMIESLIA